MSFRNLGAFSKEKRLSSISSNAWTNYSRNLINLNNNTETNNRNQTASNTSYISVLAFGAALIFLNDDDGLPFFIQKLVSCVQCATVRTTLQLRVSFHFFLSLGVAKPNTIVYCSHLDTVVYILNIQKLVVSKRTSRMTRVQFDFYLDISKLTRPIFLKHRFLN